MPSRTRPTPPSPASGGSATGTQPSVDTTRPPGRSPAPDPLPRLPHERDESVDMTGGQPDRAMRQAWRDVQRGVQDTDRGPPAHRAYQRQKR